MVGVELVRSVAVWELIANTKWTCGKQENINELTTRTQSPCTNWKRKSTHITDELIVCYSLFLSRNVSPTVQHFFLPTNLSNYLSLSLKQAIIVRDGFRKMILVRTWTYCYVLPVRPLLRGNVRPLCQENLGDCQRKRQNRYQELPENGHHVTNDFNQSDLYHSNASRGLQHTAEHSECQTHRVQAVHVVCHSKSAVVNNRSWSRQRKQTQDKDETKY